MRDSRGGLRALDRYAKPDMSGNLARLVAIVDEFLHQRTALSEDLIDVPISRFHRIKHRHDIGGRNLFMKKITHPFHENHARTLPFKRLRHAFRPKREVKAGAEGVPLHAPETLVKTLGIAVGTA